MSNANETNSNIGEDLVGGGIGAAADEAEEKVKDSATQALLAYQLGLERKAKDMEKEINTPYKGIGGIFKTDYGKLDDLAKGELAKITADITDSYAPNFAEVTHNNTNRYAIERHYLEEMKLNPENQAELTSEMKAKIEEFVKSLPLDKKRQYNDIEAKRLGEIAAARKAMYEGGKYEPQNVFMNDSYDAGKLGKEIGKLTKPGGQVEEMHKVIEQLNKDFTAKDFVGSEKDKKKINEGLIALNKNSALMTEHDKLTKEIASLQTTNSINANSAPYCRDLHERYTKNLAEINQKMFDVGNLIGGAKSNFINDIHEKAALRDAKHMLEQATKGKKPGKKKKWFKKSK